MQRISEVLEASHDMVRYPDEQLLPAEGPFPMEFRNVSFRYNQDDGVPVLDVWATKNNAGIAKKQADLAREETERTVDIDLQTTVLNCIAQARSVISSRKALEYAQKHYENELELYKLSSTSVSDLSNASSLVSTNTNQYINARYGFLSCLSAIRSLCALDSDKRVLELIP